MKLPKSLFVPAFIYLLFSTAALAQRKSGFFKDEDLMKIGVYYYPEQWPKSQWERDIKNIQKMGFEFTHFAEFAWAFMEPEEGKYDFSWLDEAVELAGKNNLKVIMCTPTATPPVWMSEKYPEILMTDANGRVMRHGGREHYSWSSPKYREFTKKIVSQLAKRYGKDRRIWGWQLDNEPSHYGAEYDFSQASRTRFIEWLKKKYNTIEKLNEVWGTSFWSLKYNSFDQIAIPNWREQVQQLNPHSWLDFKRFSAEECADFLKFQYDILREDISKDQWITTNFMGSHTPNDPSLSKNLDFVTYTTYPVAGYTSGIGEQGFRMNEPSAIGFLNDYFRNITGETGVMEMQPGQVNWGRYNPQPMPGAVRMWLWHAFAGGCKMACSYRFRQPLFGGEQYHYGMVGTDGVTPLPGGLEYAKVIEEMKMLRKEFNPKKVALPSEIASRKTAILVNRDNQWETDYQKQTDQWNHKIHSMKFYNILKQQNCPVDIITEDQDFGDYPFLVAPAYQLLDQKLIGRWKNYVEKGGHLILTCRTGQKDRNAHLWEAKFQQPIYDLIGASVEFYDHLPFEKNAHINFGEKIFEWNNWADVLVADKTTEVWAKYGDQFYAGKSAIVHKKRGKGTVTFIGPDSDDGKLEKETIKKLFKVVNIQLNELPEGLVLEHRDGFTIAINYHSTDTLEVDIPANANILMGGKSLKPTEVAIWKDK